MKVPAVVAVVCVLVAVVVAGCTAPISFDPARDKDGNNPSAATGADGDAATEKNESGLPCAVKKVLEEKCQLCHGAETNYGASTSLVTLDDLKKEFNGKKVSDLVAARVANEDRPMPPITAPALSDDEKKTLSSWIDGGLAAGKEASCEAAQKSDVPKLGCKADMKLVAKSPYKMAQDGPTDEYVCFGVDVTTDKKKHIVGFGPLVDNKKILHHILVLEADKSVSPDPQPCTPFQAKWKLITGWAPGGTAFELPAEAGMPINPGTTHYVVQLHYNNATNLAGQEDLSGFDLCTTEDLRPNDAGVLAFGSVKIDVPPRAEQAVTCDYKLDERFDGATFFGANPHMHKAGMSIGTKRLKGGTGPEEDVFSQERFDFENQANHEIDVKVSAGDVFRSTCVFKNPGDQTIKFGENTADEMCFNFLTYYPLVPDQAGALGLPVGKRLPGGGFNWVTPSVEGCGLSLGDLNDLRKQL
ncbi:MAG: hypothetical protein KIT84_40390 [Labilithrix sp.]|nr:hypothetical protein [Labilithrix sp.]MCW5817327.1 hypothetical protein [Labilithrix sp.]